MFGRAGIQLNGYAKILFRNSAMWQWLRGGWLVSLIYPNLKFFTGQIDHILSLWAQETFI